MSQQQLHSYHSFQMLNSNPQTSQEENDGGESIDFLKRHQKFYKRAAKYKASFDPTVDKDHGTSKIISTSYGDSRKPKKDTLNQRLRRICKKECEMLENDLCKKEYAIGKRHPEIGKQIPLVECADLPDESTKEGSDCITIGLSIEHQAQESKQFDFVQTDQTSNQFFFSFLDTFTIEVNFSVLLFVLLIHEEK